MEIDVIFKEYRGKEFKVKTFSSYTSLGIWISNNYSDVAIIDIVVNEE